MERREVKSRTAAAYAAAAMASAFAVASCDRQAPQAAGAEPREVRVAEVSWVEVPDEVKGFGSLSFVKKIDLASPQDAEVARMARREGDAAKAGETVVVLRNPQVVLAARRARSAVDQAKAALDLAKARLREGEFQAESRILELRKAEAELAQARREQVEQARKHAAQEELFAEGGVPEEAVKTGRFAMESAAERIRIMEQALEIRRIGLRDGDLRAAGIGVPATPAARTRALVSLSTATLRAEAAAAAARLEAAIVEAESARLAEEELVVRSPAAGIIGGRYAEEGERVKRGDKLLTVMDSGDLFAVFPAREADALRLVRGMAATVRVDATGKAYEGSVDLVSPAADDRSYTFSVRVLVPAASFSSELKPGMFARVSVVAGPPRRVVAAPSSGLADERDGEGRAWAVSNGAVSERRVALGAALGDKREVVSGLSPGEVIVDGPDGDLREGERVRTL